MKEIVCDASVIAKWFLDETNAEKALQLQQAYVEGLISLIAPDILPFDVLNALRSSNVFSIEELQTIARALSNYGVGLHPLTGTLADKTVDVAVTEEITVYDGSYVALAVLRDAICYTADEVLLHNLSKASKAYVAHLSTFER